MKFELSKEQMHRVREWMDDVDPQDPSNPDDWLKHGTIGGAFTYTFTPTSVGIVTKIFYLKDTPKEKMLDLSDYESW